MNELCLNCISLTINSKLVQYLAVNEIDEWIYKQWFIQLLEISNLDFKHIVLREIDKFEHERKYSPLDKSKGNFLDKIYLICKIYKGYLKGNPEAKFVVQFDQANVITDEAQFTPFYEFWRNFQGYWENENYFSDLPIFIFVIGHKDWQDFAALKNSVGRGVFDNWIIYNYWHTTDIKQMLEKRLKYTIRPNYQRELLDYFLCPGIIDFFGKKLGETSTQEYLDAFFGDFFRNFLSNFENNKKKYIDFLDFCKKVSRKEKTDDTYFNDIERIFLGSPALDYMPVFRLLSENQNQKWFKELFLLIKELYDKISISFDSKGLKNYKILTYNFISTNFSYDPLKGMQSLYNPPLFHDYEGKLALDPSFKRCLESIPHTPKQGPVSRLIRFVKSDRILHRVFDITGDEEEMIFYIKNIIDSSNKIFSIVQQWVINEYVGVIKENQKIENIDLMPFDKIRKYSFKLNDYYDGANTNWAIFDKNARDLVHILMYEALPKDSLVMSYFKIENLVKIKNLAFSPKSSNLRIIQLIDSMLLEFLSQIERADKFLVEVNEDFNKKIINLALEVLSNYFKKGKLPKNISYLSIKMKQLDNSFNIKNTKYIKFIYLAEYLVEKGYIELLFQENTVLISKINKDKFVNKDGTIVINKNDKSAGWRQIISNGENENIEFKSSIRYDFYQKKVNKELELVIAKSIASFLNTEGGKLCIGIDDDGNILGLKNDYETLRKKNRDGFKLKIVQLINNYLGKEFNVPNYLCIHIDNIDEKDICLIEISKSNKPVYLNGELYIRTAASTEKLSSKEAYEYIETHFNKK